MWWVKVSNGSALVYRIIGNANGVCVFNFSRELKVLREINGSLESVSVNDLHLLDLKGIVKSYFLISELQKH